MRPTSRTLANPLFLALISVLILSAAIVPVGSMDEHPYADRATVQGGDKSAEVSDSIGYWTLDDTSGADSSGNGHDGTVSGATLDTGIVAGAMRFDGSGTTVAIPAAPFDFSQLDAITVAAWVKSDVGAGAGTNDILSFWNYPDSRSWILSHHDNDQYFWEINRKGNVTGGTVSTGWTHVVGTYDTATGLMVLYVDGVSVASLGGLAGSLLDSNADLRIGGQQDGSKPFNGLIDEVRIYDRALSALEVDTLYWSVADNSPPSVPQSLMAVPFSASRIDLTWDPSSDAESGISRYVIYRDGEKVAEPANPGHPDTGLIPAVSYNYEVSAVNIAGLESATSNSVVATTLGGAGGGSSISFAQTYVDLAYGGSGKPGWVRAGDMDNDGDRDIVAGGGRALFVYENDGTSANWTRHGTLDAGGQIGANGGQLYDVDGDGDLDVVSARVQQDLGWWENPGPPLSTIAWTFHTFESRFAGWYLHDLYLVDIDNDGERDEFLATLTDGYWDGSYHVFWYKIGADPFANWIHNTVTNDHPGPNNNHAGGDAVDVDGDGDIDVPFSNGWFESSGSPSGPWVWHPLTEIYGISNCLGRDVDGDGDTDLVMSAGHHGQGVYWFENSGTPQVDGSWIRHDITASVNDVFARHFYGGPEDASDHAHHTECLDTFDLDGDGDLDVVSCELFFGEDNGEPDWNEEVHNLFVFENQPDGWLQHNVAPNSYPSHLLRLVDVNEDGRPDIISGGAGFSVVSYYENTTAFEGAGMTPDGAMVPGEPLLVEKAPGGQIELTWGAACGVSGADYAVYEGTLGDFSNHAPRSCSTLGATTWTLTPGPAASYYLAVATTGTYEGSYGFMSSEAERAPSASACLPQLVAMCP